MKTLIRGGMIYDGTGSASFWEMLFLKAKPLCFVGKKYTGQADRVIDARENGYSWFCGYAHTMMVRSLGMMSSLHRYITV